MKQASSMRKRLVITVSNNLVTDNRVAKLVHYFDSEGMEVFVLGRNWPGGALPAHRKGQHRRFKLWVNKGPLFYALLNLRLFFWLSVHRFDKVLAVDLDTLPAAWLGARLKRRPVFMDSHEFFSESPELQHRPAVKKIWRSLEAFLLPRIDGGFTVSPGIVDLYQTLFGVQFELLRNVPRRPTELLPLREVGADLVVYYQGALNVGRGLKEAIRAMTLLPEYSLRIAGSGDEEEELWDLVKALKLEKQVVFLGRLPFEALSAEAAQAHVGLCLLENMGLNYYHSLPNRLFDYPALGLPIIATNFPDMGKLVRQYNTGLLLDSMAPEVLAAAIRRACEDGALRLLWQEALPRIVADLNWEKEAKVLAKLLNYSK